MARRACRVSLRVLPYGRERRGPESPLDHGGVVDETDFDALYRGNPDPFGVGNRWYEQRKQQVLLASLGQRRYRLAWDCASGTGHLSAALAPRCDSVVA